MSAADQFQPITTTGPSTTTAGSVAHGNTNNNAQTHTIRSSDPLARAAHNTQRRRDPHEQVDFVERPFDETRDRPDRTEGYQRLFGQTRGFAQRSDQGEDDDNLMVRARTNAPTDDHLSCAEVLQRRIQDLQEELKIVREIDPIAKRDHEIAELKKQVKEFKDSSPETRQARMRSELKEVDDFMDHFHETRPQHPWWQSMAPNRTRGGHMAMQMPMQAMQMPMQTMQMQMPIQQPTGPMVWVWVPQQ